MKAKQVSLTGQERLAALTMVSVELKHNQKCKEMGIEPAWETKMLKALYEKIAGYEWRAD